MTGVTKKVLWGIVPLLLLAGCVYHAVAPQELKGAASVYNKVTLQIGDNLFYDVRVPVEAVLETTDGSTVYDFDLIRVGIQDIEPSVQCKVKVGGKWIFALSNDNWLKATWQGFEEEVTYGGSYNIEHVKWTDKVPKVVQELDEQLMKGLREGHSFALGGEEFITTQIAYGTFDTAVDKALTRLTTLYKQPIDYGMKTEGELWVASGTYTVCVSAINYNTCMIVSACGDAGRQYAAALMEVAK